MPPLSSPKVDTALHKAALGNDPAALALEIAAAPDLEAKNWFDQTPLFQAAQAGKKWALEQLLAAGADINAPNRLKETPLMAAIFGNPNGARVLLKAGADVNLASWDGDTALHVAAGHERPALISLLLKAGADPQAENSKGVTPLAMAANFGCEKSVARLLDEGVDPDFKSKDGKTALLMCSEGFIHGGPFDTNDDCKKRYPAVRALLEAKSMASSLPPAPGPRRPRKMI
jgi:ankyrin repeat protein